MPDQIWLWIGFHVFVLAMLALDLGVFHRHVHVVSLKESLTWTVVWIALAMLFNAGLWCVLGPDQALAFFTGYLIEKSLSVDNIFVFALLFSYFAVPQQLQHKVLFWGILGALTMRGVMIAAGVALIRNFSWIIYVFGTFLILTGVKMIVKRDEAIHPEQNPVVRWFKRFMPVTADYHGESFFVQQDGARAATPLFVVLLLVEISDLIFAVDSIPAIFAVTEDPFIVYTSNAFAILGLRSLYFALAGVMDRFHYLKIGLGLVLSFVGVKMMLAHTAYELNTLGALAAIAAILAGSVILSLLRPRKTGPLTRSGAAGLLLMLAAAPAAAQDTAGVGAVRGTASSADGRPAADVAVCLTATRQCDVTNADGRFAIDGVRAGTYQLEIIGPGRAGFLSQDIEVRAGLDAVVDIALPDIDTLQQSVTVTAPAFAFPEEIRSSGFLIPSEEIRDGAGALQDVSRYVQALPGVVIGADDFRNDLIVRGGSPLENLFIVDNVEVPNINTFATFASAGGTVSMLDSAIVQDVTFLTGGYPATYGNRTSSVLQITQREGNRTQVAARATLGFAGAGAVVEGPIGGGAGSWVVSARRSFLDLVTDDVGIGGVPVLYTFNGKAVYDASPRDRLWLVNLSGVDNIRLGLTEDSDPSDELSNLDIRYRGRRSATGLNWQRLYGTRGVGLFGLSYSRASVHQQVKDLIRDGIPPPGTPVEAQLAAGTTVFREASTESEVTLKYDLTSYLPMVGKIQTGGSVKRLAVSYDTASPLGTDSPFFPVAEVNPFTLNERASAPQLGAYLQGTRALGRRTSATVGARVDRYQYLGATRLSPRIGLDHQATGRLSLRASYGRYVQQPFFLFLSAYPENRLLDPFRADHFVAGLAYAADDATRATVEVYHKVYGDYPVSSQIPSLSLANVGDTFAVRDILFPMVSRGGGRATGVELFVERKAGASRWHGQANLAFSRVRHAGLDAVLRPGSFDYPVVANLTGGYRVSPQWDVSTRVSYLAGRPVTPFDARESTAQRRAVYDLTRVNAGRIPDYFRLDVRVDRRFLAAGRDVSIFAGVQNLTGRRNVAGYSWDRRQNAARVNEQLGLFPILGIDWRF